MIIVFNTKNNNEVKTEAEVRSEHDLLMLGVDAFMKKKIEISVAMLTSTINYRKLVRVAPDLVPTFKVRISDKNKSGNCQSYC